MHHEPTDTHICEATSEETVGIPSEERARLQTIHDLIQSGSYHVPASAIADRMIERLLGDRQGSKS
jgi:anti-sigma28 factor (negative regulator of flagellin synthesis)